MRIAFLYGKFSIGPRPLDFDHLYDSPRGLTGSELSCIEYARAMKARGHEVVLVVGQPMARREWQGLDVRQLDSPRVVEDCDVVYSWNEPNLFFEVAPGPLRVVNQQLNDFAYCRAGWEHHVDLVTSPSAHHLAYLQKQAPGVKAWEVMPNGCDPTQYASDRRVPGRVIWASSADRGLHLLLSMWPEIKQRVAHASLRCFYHFEPAHFDDYEAVGQNVHPDLLEIAQRKRYIRYAMGKLAGPTWDVEHVGSVSRERMAREFEQAEVLAYPCDTIRYTEGFSVTTMEACASGCLPIITDIDALGQIYGGAAPMVPVANGFTKNARVEFVELVVRGLANEDWRDEQASLARMLAEQHAWPVLAERLEKMLQRELAKRAPPKKTKKPTDTRREVAT
jgi:glycosyltransferase involved in cell wall biosynthesis